MTLNKNEILEIVDKHIGKLICHQGMKITKHAISNMNEWYVIFENDEFIISISHDRGGT